MNNPFELQEYINDERTIYRIFLYKLFKLFMQYYYYFTYEPAYSMFSKKCQCCWHSTNRSKSYDRQNAIAPREHLRMNEMLGKRNITKQDD